MSLYIALTHTVIENLIDRYETDNVKRRCIKS